MSARRGSIGAVFGSNKSFQQGKKPAAAGPSPLTRGESGEQRSGGNAILIDLSAISRTERSKGLEFYDFCIDLVCDEHVVRMRPGDRGEMQAWLGVLQMQLTAFHALKQLTASTPLYRGAVASGFGDR